MNMGLSTVGNISNAPVRLKGHHHQCSFMLCSTKIRTIACFIDRYFGRECEWKCRRAEFFVVCTLHVCIVERAVCHFGFAGAAGQSCGSAFQSWKVTLLCACHTNMISFQRGSGFLSRACQRPGKIRCRAFPLQ